MALAQRRADAGAEAPGRTRREGDPHPRPYLRRGAQQRREPAAHAASTSCCAARSAERHSPPAAWTWAGTRLL
ncbi:MAG: hypothetical protein MZW92_17795 [Comamonadaceae bacterium]|nr:hypothetical protein [Comamonadaceae bacterium]